MTGTPGTLATGAGRRRLRRWWPLAVVLVVLWGVAGYLIARPTSFHQYRRAAVQAAESGYDALATTQLTVGAQLDGKVTGPATDTTLDWAASAVAGAWQKFAALAPVDDETARMRDELAPALAAAVRVLGDVRTAEDSGPTATAQALQRVDPVADQLSDFVDRHR